MGEADKPVSAPKSSLINDPRFRAIFIQVITLALVILGFYFLWSNAAANLARQNIATGFGFLNQTANFGINQTLIDYSPTSSYGRVFFVGLTNTLLVAVIGIFFATLLGFVVGIARLSSNWIISKLAAVYVEMVRNVPLLLQIFFWYFAVIQNLPGRPADSINILDTFYISGRGLIAPAPVTYDGFSLVVYTFIAAFIASRVVKYWAKKRQLKTGQIFPILWVNLGIMIGLPLLVFIALGRPMEFVAPELTRFNFRGGITINGELLALTLALVIYTAGFIAEIVRAGILAVSHGQTEAAFALGIKPSRTLKLVIVPQALRVIIPPLTSQYLNLTKNSSLAVAIGYPDLMSVFGGTTLNQTGQAVEVLTITAAIYLTLSLTTSLFMNIYNRKIALVER